MVDKVAQSRGGAYSCWGVWGQCLRVTPGPFPRAQVGCLLLFGVWGNSGEAADGAGSTRAPISSPAARLMWSSILDKLPLNVIAGLVAGFWKCSLAWGLGP